MTTFIEVDVLADETCRYCGLLLPFDEEVMCEPCRTSHRRERRLNTCRECGVELSCTCCETCDDCSYPVCDACSDAYDDDEEGGMGYCGACYRDRYCSECERWGQGYLFDGLCDSCAPPCEDCGTRTLDEDLEDGYCGDCLENHRCSECTDIYGSADLTMGVCTECLTANAEAEVPQ